MKSIPQEYFDILERNGLPTTGKLSEKLWHNCIGKDVVPHKIKINSREQVEFLKLKSIKPAKLIIIDDNGKKYVFEEDAQVLRWLNNIINEGVSKSKIGKDKKLPFAKYNVHEFALKVLRAINYLEKYCPPFKSERVRNVLIYDLLAITFPKDFFKSRPTSNKKKEDSRKSGQINSILRSIKK